jgi:hypothetical protein
MNEISRTWKKWWAAGSTLKLRNGTKHRKRYEHQNSYTSADEYAQKGVQRRWQNNMGVDLVTPYFLNWKQQIILYS